jgi:hypothetical protein
VTSRKSRNVRYTNKSRDVRYAQPVAQLTFQRARTAEKKRQRAEALVEAACSLALEAGAPDRRLCRGAEVVPPEWNLDFATAPTRLLTATCVGLISGSSGTRREARGL